MASKPRKSNNNKLRTQLLILANNELSRIKKNNFTQINSKYLQEFENAYANLNNNNVIILKEENFVSHDDYSDVIQSNTIKGKFVLESPDEYNKCAFLQNKKNIFCGNSQAFYNQLPSLEQEKAIFFNKLGISNPYQKEIEPRNKQSNYKMLNLNNKSLISFKKILHFQSQTLKFFQKEVTEKDLNIAYDKDTSKRKLLLF